MRFFLFLSLILIFCLSGFAASEPFDRAARHDTELGDIDLWSRASAASVRGSDITPAEFSEIMISSTVSPARFDQDNAQVLSLGDNGWLVAWDDDRNGNNRVFWQRYDTLGAAVGTNEMVAWSVTGNHYSEPVLASDTLGRVYLFYRDKTAGMIFGRRYDSNLEIEQTSFLVNDTSGNAFAGLFDVAVFPDGQTVVVWEDYSTAGSNIHVRVYSSSGTTVVGPVAVNSDGGDEQHWEPAVAIAPGSGFLVTWEDYRNGNADIYARQYSGSGTAVGSEFPLVAPPVDAEPQYSPAVTYSAKDRYVIGWVDHREGQDIYLQRFDQTSGLVGDNQLLSSGDTLVTNWDLDLGVKASDQVYACWSDFGVTNRILGLTLDSGLVPVGQAVARNAAGTGRRWAPDVAFDPNGNYALVWTEFADDQADIHFMLFDTADAALLGSEVEVNDDIAGAQSSDPFIAAGDRYSALVCFMDKRRDAGDIYVRAISRIGDTYGLDHRVNQDAGSALQTEPASAGFDQGSLIVWIDARLVNGFSGQRIYGRYASTHGWFGDPEFMISDTAENAVKASPKAALAPDHRTLVAWVDNRDGTAQVWGRWIDAVGALDGAEFQISNDLTDSSATDLFAAADSAGHFYVAWLDIGLETPEAKVVWYNGDKSEGGRFSWASSVPTVSINEISADVFPGGELGLFWTGDKLGVSSAYLTQFDSDGSVLVAPFVVTDDTLSNASSPALAVDNNGKAVMSWEDRRSGVRVIFYQLADAALTLIGNNTSVTASYIEFMATPSVDAYYGWGWITWADPRVNGLNIYASAFNYDPTSVEPDPSENLPNSFRLSQNYPNPFNPETVIAFYLPERSEISLEIFNIQGQRVKHLALGEYAAGEHNVVWDGTDRNGNRVASGVYLYRLTADGKSDSRKMMLLK